MSRDLESLPDGGLVRHAQDGDARAVDVLVRRYVRPALAVALEFTDGSEDAEDLVQEAFHRALQRLGQFDGRRPFGPWFFTILRNLGRNVAARRRLWRTVPLSDSLATEHRSPLEEAHLSEMRARLVAAVESLPQMQRACFRLCDVEGFKRTEVAEMLGVTAGTVRTHLHRARLALREVLPPAEEGTPLEVDDD